MKFEETKLAGSYVINLEPYRDERGWFARTYSKDEFKKIGFNGEWVQLNHSFTKLAGTIRGMHFQLPPFAEIKLVRCVAGRVFDVMIDLRYHSSTFLQWFGVELSAAKQNMVYIPDGFAHGFESLSDDCELVYHHSQSYQPGLEGGIRFDDPLVAIEWPVSIKNISERDSTHPNLSHDFEGLKIQP